MRDEEKAAKVAETAPERGERPPKSSPISQKGKVKASSAPAVKKKRQKRLIGGAASSIAPREPYLTAARVVT